MVTGQDELYKCSPDCTMRAGCYITGMKRDPVEFILQAIDLVKELIPSCKRESADRRKTLRLLRRTARPLSRDQFEPGHLTASGIVFSPDHQDVLLVHHRRLDRWLQPGGHVEEDDESPLATARREVIEETGVTLTEDHPPFLYGVHIHVIPASELEPEHLHYDMMFEFHAADTLLEPGAEVVDAKWTRFECSLFA